MANERTAFLYLLGGGALALGGAWAAKRYLGFDVLNLNSPRFEPGTTIPTATPTLVPTIEPTIQTAIPTESINITELVKKEWPKTAEEFVAATKLKRSDIEDKGILEYLDNLEKAGVEVVELNPKDVIKELDGAGNWTGGWVIPPRKDPNTGPYFYDRVYLLQNKFRNMQYGYMEPVIFREILGYTEAEVASFGWGFKDDNNDGKNDWIGSGIPSGYMGPASGATFYPLYSMETGEVHQLMRDLGPDKQTVQQRLAMNIRNGLMS